MRAEHCQYILSKNNDYSTVNMNACTFTCLTRPYHIAFTFQEGMFCAGEKDGGKDACQVS